MKRIISGIMTAVFFLTFAVSPVYADAVTGTRVTIGANLTAEQKAIVYADFGIKEGDVDELTVTNAEEREYLEGLVPNSKIGTRAISCIYIETLEEGKGLEITTRNISWCSHDMYRNALVTAGITDATVKVSAPFEVSGTAALTGIYKAYEDIYGEELDEDAKAVGAEELVVTGELGESIGTEEAAELVAELKKLLDKTKDMPDEEVREEIKRVAVELNITLTAEQIEELLKLMRSMEGLDIAGLQERLEGILSGDSTAGFFQSIGDFFSNLFKGIGEFFSRMFGGGEE